MYLRCNRRFKDGKEHHYWNIVESKRCHDGRIIQRQVLYLGEINDSQHEAWCRVIEAFDEERQSRRQLALFPADRALPAHAKDYGVKVELNAMRLKRPRQWGACWLACQLFDELQLDTFWRSRLPDSREGTAWAAVLQTLIVYRLIDPGSEWRLHRQWFASSAMGDLLGYDERLVEKNVLYRCLDKILPHREAFFCHVRTRYQDLFGARFEILLYDLTSTYFEIDPPLDEADKRRFGYSRDKRFDCVQVVIALIVTPEGFPLAYEVLPGNTSDKTTLKAFLAKIEATYGIASRTWVMDRGVPTEEVLEEMREAHPPVYYLVGTPKGQLTQLERELLPRPWEAVRDGVRVKYIAKDNEYYWLTQRLQEIAQMKSLSRDSLLMKLGAAQQKTPAAWRLFCIDVAEVGAKFTYRLDRVKLRAVRRREGRYLLRTNLTAQDPAHLWKLYVQLSEVEAAFKNLKDDLALRPIYHQLEHRIEAHIFIAFMSYCLHVTLRAKLKRLASGLTPRTVLDKFAAIQMLDVRFPTTDGRELILTRYTEPEADQKMLLAQLNLTLPPQPPPRITAAGTFAG